MAWCLTDKQMPGVLQERESESGVSTEHRLSLTGAGTAAVNKPHALCTGAADMGTPQAPIRSLEDLQVSADGCRASSLYRPMIAGQSTWRAGGQFAFIRQ